MGGFEGEVESGGEAAGDEMRREELHVVAVSACAAYDDSGALFDALPPSIILTLL